MNKFNIWLWDANEISKSGNGGWTYLCICQANTESEAIQLAQTRYGRSNKYQAYPHIDNHEFDTKRAPVIDPLPLLLEILDGLSDCLTREQKELIQNIKKTTKGAR